MGRRRFSAGIGGLLRTQDLQFLQRALKQLGLTIALHPRFSQGIANFSERMFLETDARLQFRQTLFYGIRHRSITASADRAPATDSVIGQAGLLDGLGIIDIATVKYHCIGKL